MVNSVYGSSERRLISRVLAVMYGAATIDGVVEVLLPRTPSFSLLPIVAVAVITSGLLVAGHRLPIKVLFGLGVLGALLIGYAQGTTTYVNDGAVLFALPVIFLSLFWGRRGAAVALVAVAVAETVGIGMLPGGGDHGGRLLDIMIAEVAVAISVIALGERGADLMRLFSSEARTDQLTQLLNRRGFDERAERVLARAVRNATWCSVVVFDLDHFKAVNDCLGHEAGDSVLRHFANILRSAARATDLLARFGGEEFVVLLPDTSPSQAREFAERVRLTLADDTVDDRLSIRVSAGIAGARGAVSLAMALKQADLALYEAKDSGRDRTCVSSAAATVDEPVAQAAPVQAPRTRRRLASRRAIARTPGAGHLIRDDRRMMARTAAGMCVAAAISAVVQLGFGGHRTGSHLIVIACLAAVPYGLLVASDRLPRPLVATLGPCGVALCAYALATSPSMDDIAVLYALPVLFQTMFFGRRGAVCIVLMVAVADAIALVALPHGLGYPARWVDVMLSVVPIALVVLTLESRNETLLRATAAEARIDPLTGLLNRRGFVERAAAEVARLGRGSHVHAVVTFDIDHFKEVNDRWGHDIGDRVLQHVASLLRERAREIDILARFGGEEFMVLLPDSDAGGAEAFAQAIRAALPRVPDGLPPVRVSGGITTAAAVTDLDDLLRQADAALYVAKRGGRDRIEHHSAADSQPAARPTRREDRRSQIVA